MADAGTSETGTPGAGPVATPYERIGGAVVVDRLVESFYHRMDTLPDAKGIRAMHGSNLGPIKYILKRYLSEWLGGPKLYSPEKGHPRLRQRHMGFAIGNAERDAWLLCMRGALEETVTDVQARHDVDAAMTKLADWMRNQAGNPHDARAARP
ncbi:group II truncated hemoglobin [Bradyrhizobium sp. SZCCHNPS1003]|uniref:group II truncated hemoglobin n=1 Tax=Bradyrhizobium sp. SZCCHNPS1003 TaxID=3057330 RepID=UPI0028E28F16|nr:group II truncated hemoglobin [Bradyrhizobium sp. SZCCHNPS1003]